MKFGDLVLVRATVVRLVRYNNSQITTHRDAMRYGPVLTSPTDGEALDGSDNGDGAGSARVRRFPFVEPLRGVVVGFTVRLEGQRASTPNAFGYERETYLAQSRRVDVVEVALEATGKARLILALAADLDVLRPYPFTKVDA